MEIVGVDQASADGFLRHLRQLMDEHNAFRGQVVSFHFGMYGHFGLTFTRLPNVRRDDVVLPRASWTRSSSTPSASAASPTAPARPVSTSSEASYSTARRAPASLTPSSYLVGAMAGRTTIILTGGAVAAVGQAGTIARQLQPATIVIEDVDLIGMDRQLPGGEHNALLFQLLNEMDGLAGDADVLFVLTTNRVDMLEPALAARPGRVGPGGRAVAAR